MTELEWLEYETQRELEYDKEEARILSAAPKIILESRYETDKFVNKVCTILSNGKYTYEEKVDRIIEAVGDGHGSVYDY